MNDTTGAMKRVFDLAEKLNAHPEEVRLAQALTLNPDRPQMGLRGTNGLFGSDEWWANLKSGKMPIRTTSGVIRKAYCVGQGDSGPINTLEVLKDDGSVGSIGIYLNERRNLGLFKVGHRVERVYALDELKQQPGPDGGINYAEVTLEMSVSEQPA